MLSALPIARGTLLFLDVGALRKGGILELISGSKAAEEPDYRNFVAQTGFDYRTDLDAVAAVFDSGQVYVTVRGRFDWTQLAAYARAQGGTCQYLTCSMPASAPDRHISFYPIRGNVLALAVTTEERGANMISDGQAKPKALPDDPAWLWTPRETIRDAASMPPGLQLLLSPVADAQSVSLSAGPAPDDKGLRLRARVTFASADAAAALVRQFQSLTSSLRNLADQAGRSAGADSDGGDPADSNGLGALLAKGKIERNDSVATAEWPLEPSFLKSMAEERPK